MAHRCLMLFAFAGLLGAPHLGAVEAQKQIPAEYESTSALGAAMNNAGYAANDSHAAIRANPALLPLEKTYSVSGGYHWPASGREFYQASVVDAKTSSLAAGASYTGYMDDYKRQRQPLEDLKHDSPLTRRAVLGLAQLVGNISVGAGATYVESSPVTSSDQAEQSEERVRGFGLNVGFASAVNARLRVGASAENISNKRIAEYVPTAYRGGLAYGFTPTVTGYLDYRYRERVAEFEAPDIVLAAESDEASLDKAEQMVVASASVQVQDFLRLLASYGQALTDERRALAGGIAVVNKNFTLSYTTSRPYMAQSATHQAVSLGFQLAM